MIITKCNVKAQCESNTRSLPHSESNTATKTINLKSYNFPELDEW